MVGIDISLQSINDSLNKLLLDALIVGAIVNIITVIIAYLLFKPFVMRIGSFTSKIKTASENKDLSEKHACWHKSCYKTCRRATQRYELTR